MLQFEYNHLCELSQAEEIYTGAVREVKEETGVSFM